MAWIHHPLPFLGELTPCLELPYPTYLLASQLVPPSFSGAKTKGPLSVNSDADSFLLIYVNSNLTDTSFCVT